MKNLTIRNIESDLYQALKKEARRRGLGIYQYVLLILREAAGIDNGQPRHADGFHELDYLAGTWTEEEYRQFENELKHQRIVDDRFWQ